MAGAVVGQASGERIAEQCSLQGSLGFNGTGEKQGTQHVITVTREPGSVSGSMLRGSIGSDHVTYCLRALP